MSKANGSITPRTVRREIDFIITREEADTINQYDSQFQGLYAQRDQTRSEILARKDLNVRKLDQLSKYCEGGPLKGLKSQFSKKADALLKTSEVLELINQNQIPQSLEFVKIFQHRDDKTPDLEFDLSKPVVKHYGIHTSASIFVEHVITDDQLHPLESSVFKRALDYLETKCSAREFINLREGEESIALPKPNNVVLVSFFPRKGNESDKLLLARNKTMVADEKFPKEAETHTIVLWKTAPREITIIDPTDKTFSQFLKEMLETAYPGQVFQIENSNIDGVDGKIYKPKHGATTKKLSELARDCTDIAVKIAFELNEKQTSQLVLSPEAVLFSAIEQISNANLPKEIGLFRALQSSDFDIRLAAKELVNTNSLILKALDITKIDTLENIQEISGLLGDLNIEDVSV